MREITEVQLPGVGVRFTSFPAPDPGFVLRGGDVAVAVGTAEGLTQLPARLAR